MPPYRSTPQIPIILIADDDIAHRMLLKYELENENYEVIEASDGQEAVSIFEMTPADVVLLDWNMPEMTGVEACAAIRQLPRGAHVPIIMITVLDDQDQIDYAFEMGATDYINKPINKAILRQRLRKILQARKSDKLREDLVRMLVHDMKTPITAIKLGSEVMMDEGGTDPTMLELIRDNSLRLLNLVMGILDASRLQEGKLTLRRTDRNVGQALSELRDSFSWMHITRGIIVALDPVDPILQASVDWALIERVLINLISNAFKHSPNHSTITLSAGFNAEQYLVITVSDQGEGISPDDQKRIFEEFTTALARKQGSTLDTGLGLTFCKMAIEAHGGNIRVESNLGEGAKFMIELPITLSESVENVG
jgi:signal transduction histidine kinase